MWLLLWKFWHDILCWHACEKLSQKHLWQVCQGDLVRDPGRLHAGCGNLHLKIDYIHHLLTCTWIPLGTILTRLTIAMIFPSNTRDRYIPSIFAVAYNLHVVASTPLVQCNKKSLLLAPPEWLDRVTFFDPFVSSMIGGYQAIWVLNQK